MLDKLLSREIIPDLEMGGVLSAGVRGYTALSMERQWYTGKITPHRVQVNLLLLPLDGSKILFKGIFLTGNLKTEACSGSFLPSVIAWLSLQLR